LGVLESIHQVKTAINIPPRLKQVDEGLLTDRAATDFVKGMSHELHTPLHVIIGLCQLLERDRNATLSSAQLDAVERMERNARNLLQTVNHLLACLRSGHFE
jgi:signal transduction histidine kinase